jgi:hypothetical protein
MAQVQRPPQKGSASAPNARLYGIVTAVVLLLALVALLFPQFRKSALLIGGGILLFLVRYALFKGIGPVGLPFSMSGGRRARQLRTAMAKKKAT